MVSSSESRCSHISELRRKRRRSELDWRYEVVLGLHLLLHDLEDHLRGSPSLRGAFDFDPRIDMHPRGKGKNVEEGGRDDSGHSGRVANWTHVQDRLLIMCMLEARDQNYWSEKSFTTVGWNGIMQQFNEQAGLRFTKDHIQSRWKIFKRDHAAYLYLRNKSGWGWDNVGNYPVTPDEMAWLEVDNSYRKYKTRPFLYFEDVSYIIGAGTATGWFARSSRGTIRSQDPRNTQADQEEEEQDEAEGIVEVPTPPVVSRATQRSSGSKRQRSADGKTAPLEMSQFVDMIQERIGAHRREQDEDVRTAYQELKEACPIVSPASFVKLEDALAHPTKRELFWTVKDDPDYLQAWVHHILGQP